MTSFAIRNFGCRVNQAEAAAWAEEFEASGLEMVNDPSRAEIVIVNTCTLTASADRDGRKFIRRVVRLNPDARLVVTGCGVDAGRVRLDEPPASWLVLRNGEKSGLVERVLSRVGRGTGVVSPSFRSRALLKVQDGCNLQCAFCIIPHVRGPARSEAVEKLVGRTRDFISRGFREIVLCGIHLSSYGRDLHPPSSLVELLRRLTAEEGLGRIRLSSLDPRFFDEELLDFVTSSPRICPHFHLSLQHTVDRVLRLMGRGATSERNARLAARLRERAPDAAIGADIIVGFPEESGEDFAGLVNELRSLPLSYLHVFAYSPRPGTPAASRPQVAETEKRTRSAIVRAVSREMRMRFRQSMIGKELDAVVIKNTGRRGQVLTGNYLAVDIDDCPAAPGEEIRVRVVRLEGERPFGEAIGEREGGKGRGAHRRERDSQNG